jgi:dTDP-4-dehydrorhamnose 3,5-epimerase
VSEQPFVDGVRFSPRRIIETERGAVLHFLRRDQPEFDGAAEVYFSEVRRGMVKAWKRHRRMTQRFVTPVGQVRYVVFDDRPSSPTAGSWSEVVSGRLGNYGVLTVPPLVWYGFSCVGDRDALIANCPDLAHDPDEGESADLSDPRLPVVW